MGLLNSTKLSFINLFRNNLTGTIPSSIGYAWPQLTTMHFGFNQFSGGFDFITSLTNCKNLIYIVASGNPIQGVLPDSVGNLTTDLLYFLIQESLIYGRIPVGFGNLSNLLVIDLEANQLTGELPSDFLRLKKLEGIFLDHNRISGTIPFDLGELTGLNVLTLDENMLSGSIPDSVGNMTGLQHLSLAGNRLSSSIPSSLWRLKGVIDLRLSRNTLHGTLPMIKEGDLEALDTLNLSKNRLSGNLRSISYYELLRATDNFSEANLLGKGGFSSVFKGCLDDGLSVAVKVLNLEVQGALKSFYAECCALGMLRHRNLVKIISACSNQEFKALVLEFMPNGNLEQWLNSHNRYLNLHQRLDIMVNVSLAIEYLHHDHPDVVLHCDLKPNNVLLDEDMVAHVGDFGIAKLLLGDGISALSASAPGTIGYIAPEYGLTGRISRKGDVYSFGILLLETFTRKRPSDAFDGGLSLRQWVCEAYPDGILKIVDDSLLREEAMIMTQRQPAEVLEVIHQCLSSVIKLGLVCSEQSPKERISMRDVVPMLQKIMGEYVSNAL